jgi:two-component system nitrogen regulation sensor histidine kinase NtrY
MSIGAKIRFLLLILGLCCIATAISLKHSISRADLLQHEAGKLQENLLVHEQLVHDFLLNPANVENAKHYDLKDELSLDFINNFRDQGINILVYFNNELRFWSSYKAFPLNTTSLKEGSSFIQLPNGWYEAIKKTSGKYTIIFLLDVKTQYSIQNKYLQNRFSPQLCKNNSLTLASFSDDEAYGIKDSDGRLLFEVKLLPNYTSSLFSTVEIWLWIVGLFSLCLFFNAYCSLLVKRGHLLLATALIALFFIVFRLTDLEFGWFNHQFSFELFDPKVYAESFFLPSLGDFLINIISITWIILFIYTYKGRYRLPAWLTKNSTRGILVHLAILCFFAVLGVVIDHIFFGLINNSKINFNITNIINLGWISWISISILCLVWFNTYLLASILMTLSLQLKVNNRQRFFVFLLAFGTYMFFKFNLEFSIFLIAYCLFIFLLGWNIYIQENKFYVYIYALMFFCLAFISAVKYLKYNDVKEKGTRLIMAEKLQSTDDPKVYTAIESMEERISTDTFISNYFNSGALRQHVTLDNYIRNRFFDGLSSQFDYNIYDYSNEELQQEQPGSRLNYYRNLVKAGSVKISTYFYRINDTFDYQNYFAILPIFTHDRLTGTLIIELKSRQYNYNSQLPELLVGGKSDSEQDYNTYSFAFYNKGKLIKQSGKYTYKLSGIDFKRLKAPGFINDRQGFNHLIYKPNSNKLVIISKENVSPVLRLATLSFFFLVFIIFSAALYILIWVVKNIDESWSGWFNINRSLMINANKILYKTRIQFSIILSVVATLLIVGWTTYFYISSEYRKQQDEFMREKIRKVQVSYEKQIAETGVPPISDESIAVFNQFADINASYLNLYDVKGNLIYSSLPKIFDYGIIGRKMGPKAFIYLSNLQRSEYLNPSEKIGDFTYSSAYAPIRNTENRTVAYIGLPYYGNETDYQSKIGLFVNTLINIYALVFVGIGILAVFLANQITGPLTFIQESIRKTKLGQINKPIVWSRHDEIGSLIKEYNKMISALEDSARKLARSEREHAWREMAKQIAHEIKNPLTPLKLGVQLLEKSWKENDPNFDKKFERFSKSFIEQIDSLATIASEFSSFAKMPDTKLEKLNVLPILEECRRINGTASKTEIHIHNEVIGEVLIMGDKGQLLKIFNNLFENSIEAGNGEDITVIDASVRTSKAFLIIEVSDNAMGIDESVQDKIFVPNFTTKSSGTGLGLAFVKQAVENAGGTVYYNSVENVGTTFFLSFPRVS